MTARPSLSTAAAVEAVPLRPLAAQRERAVAPELLGVAAPVDEREHVAAVRLGLNVKRERPDCGAQGVAVRALDRSAGSAGEPTLRAR
jgi:hypothetical protein